MNKLLKLRISILQLQQLIDAEELRLKMLRATYIRKEQHQAQQAELDLLRERGLYQRELLEELQGDLRELIVERQKYERFAIFSIPFSLQKMLDFPGPLTRLVPEDCVAVLEALHNRLLKRNLPERQVKGTMLRETIVLLWSVYVQIKFENLWLPKQNRAHSVSTPLLRVHIAESAAYVFAVANAISVERNSSSTSTKLDSKVDETKLD